MLDAFMNEEADKDYNELTSVYMVFEYIQFDMKELLESTTRIEEEQAIILSYNLLLSMNFIRKANVIHRDLKPSNILVTSNCTIKIADFGLSRTIEPDDDDDSSRALSPVCYTRYYRPPEVILQQKSYDFAADVWSLGCLIFELFKHSTLTEKQLKKEKSKLAFHGGSCFPISPVYKNE